MISAQNTSSTATTLHFRDDQHRLIHDLYQEVGFLHMEFTISEDIRTCVEAELEQKNEQLIFHRSETYQLQQANETLEAYIVKLEKKLSKMKKGKKNAE